MKMQSIYFYVKQLGTEANSLLQQNLFSSIIGAKTQFKTAALKKDCQLSARLFTVWQSRESAFKLEML